MKRIVLFLAMTLALPFAFSEVEGYTTFQTDDENAPVVYFTKDISPEGLVRVYKAMGWTPRGKVGVKISTGEPPASNYLRPELIGALVKDELHGTIVECNTIYGGSRASNALHRQVAKDHGFLEIADFDLQDEKGFMQIPVKGGTHLKFDYVGRTFKDYGSYLVLSHFKGHAMGGFGGAIKNLSIGFGSGQSVKKSGKALIHSAGKTTGIDVWNSVDFSLFAQKAPDLSGNKAQIAFLESMAEAAKGVCDYMKNEQGIAFVNVMNRLSVDCDCGGSPAEPDMHDIGILASLDPLAIDQACVDLVFTAADSASLVERIETRQGRHTLEHAEAIGLGKGSRRYRLIELE